MIQNEVWEDVIRVSSQAHHIEEVGEKLRSMMPWITENALVDKTKN